MDLYDYFFKNSDLKDIFHVFVQGFMVRVSIFSIAVFELRVRTVELEYGIKSKFIFIKYNKKNKLKYSIDDNTNMKVEYIDGVYYFYVDKKEYKNNNVFLYNKFLAYKFLGFYPTDGVLNLTLKSKNTYIDDTSELLAMNLLTLNGFGDASKSSFRVRLNEFLNKEIYQKEYNFDSYKDKSKIDFNFLKETMGHYHLSYVENIFRRQTGFNDYDDLDTIIKKIGTTFNYKFHIEMLDFAKDEASSFGVKKHSGLYANKINDKEIYIAFNTNINENKSRYLFLKLIGYDIFKAFLVGDSLILNLPIGNSEIETASSNFALDLVVTFDMTNYSIYRNYEQQQLINKYTDYDLISLSDIRYKRKTSSNISIDPKAELHYVRDHEKEYPKMKGKKDNGKV